MDLDYYIIIGVLGLFVILSTILGIQINTSIELKEQLKDTERVLTDVEVQFTELCAENTRLRSLLMQTYENLSISEIKYSACQRKLPVKSVVMPPEVRISLDNLFFSEDRVVIMVDDLIPGIIAPSNSMSPLLGADHIVLEKVPESEKEIFVGDIIIFEEDNNRIIHRVIEIGEDEQGWYAITRGDNNIAPDRNKVRFQQVKGITVGIIY